MARTAIITGAGSGLGRALSARLARDGWQLALCDINTAGNEQTLAAIRAASGGEHTAASGIEHTAETLDVSDAEAWSNLVTRLQARWPQLDLLVNNAGVACAGEVGQLPLADWRWLLNVNLWGVIHGCHACVGWLKQNPAGGHVVNIASVAGLVFPPEMAAYNVSKAAVIALSETMSAELRAHRVGVTVVCPGFVATNLLATGRFASESQRQSAERLMNESTMTPDHVANAIARAIRRRQLYLVVPPLTRLLWWLKRFLPAGITRAIGWEYERERTRREAAAARHVDAVK